ncbi:MAG: M48 family metalloprotease [Gammaproteobacteria bacterium]|nr:M48 family metalloprotease [Gammaproteobacteria bacterium]
MRRIAQACLLAISVSLTPAMGSTTDISLPDIGPNARTPDEERRLGEAFMRIVRQEVAVINDPELSEYIWNLGYKLVANSDFRGTNFSFFMVQDNSINAFAGPGGYIGVHSGLILTAENEGELAAVLAHEIAHVTQHHLDRAMEAEGKMDLPLAAAIAAAIILGSQNSNIAEAAIVTGIAANVQSRLNFSRSHEREADQIGMRILVQSSYDPQSMPAFFERMQQGESLSDSAPEFLRTHPVTINRIAESKNRANQYQIKTDNDSQMFHLMRAKLQVMASQNLPQLIRAYEQELKAGTFRNEIAHRYGYAQALLANNDFDRAREQASLLIKKDGEKITYDILFAQIELASGRVAQGLRKLDDALVLSPSNPVLAQLYATALLRNEQPHKAKQILLTVPPERRTANFLKLHAQAERDSGFPGRSHQLLAEYYYQMGYTRTAIDQLNLALREKDIETAEAGTIRARIDELKDLVRQERQQANQ